MPSLIKLICRGLLTILLHIYPTGSHAQEADSPLWSARLHRGFIIPHSRELIDVSRTNPFGLELNLHWTLSDEKYIRQTGLIAKRGLAVYYINFDNPRVLGYSLALVPYVEPLIRPWGRVYGSIQMGLGPAFVSRVYNEKSNPTNLFFSLPVSLWAMLNAQIYTKINARWSATLGFNYNHISNGGMKNPNKGMNFPTFNAGVQFSPKNIVLRRPFRSDEWKQGPRFFSYLLAAGSVKNVPAAPPEHPDIKPGLLYGAQWMAGWRVGRMSAVSVGTEWIFDGYDREVLDRRSDPTSTWKGGVLIGHELLVGRVRFTVHLGPYLYNPSRETDLIYQRYGLFYRIGRRFLVGSTMKAHRHVADVFDLRAGYLW